MAIIIGALFFDKDLPRTNFQECIQYFEKEKFECSNLLIKNCQFSVLFHRSQVFSKADYFHEDTVRQISVIFFGNIYNELELIQKFGQQETVQATPKLIYSLFVNYGEKFVQELNGDFSIIILDKKNKKSFIYRDHIGVRPMNYFYYENKLYFSNDALIFLKILEPNTKINKEVFSEILQESAYNDFTLSLGVGIKKVLPGHYLKFSENNVASKKYWFPEQIAIQKNISKNEVVKTLGELVEDAVRIRCDLNKNAASHVSGGLDSSLISALVRKNYSQQNVFFAFSWSPSSHEISEEYIDERNLINELACKYDLKIEYMDLEVDQYWEGLENWRVYDLTVYDDQILKKCEIEGIDILFSGWGGDDFLSINNRGLYFDLFFGLHWNLLNKKKPFKKLKGFLGMLYYNVFLPTFHIYYNRFPSTKWYEKYFLKTDYIKKKPGNPLSEIRSRKKTHLNSIYSYHLAWRMESEFILGNQHGVKYRYPLLDKRIIEYILQIPSNIIASFPYMRPLIREVSKGILPESIRLHIPKEDAARLDYLFQHYKETLPLFLKDFNEIKNNPELDFVNFDNIEKDIEKLKNEKYEYDEFDFLLFLNKLKKMHELVKGIKS